MGPHTLRDMLADLLELPQQRVRVLTHMVGGGYGSKMYLRAIQPAAALLAMKLPNRHVRLVFDREDEFLSCAGRLPTRTTIRTGVSRDGRLVARGSFTPSARAFPGARYLPPAESPEEADWDQVRALWEPDE